MHQHRFHNNRYICHILSTTGANESHNAFASYLRQLGFSQFKIELMSCIKIINL